MLIGADSLTILAENGYYLLGYPMPPDGSPLRRLGWAWYDATRNDLLRRTGSVRDHVVRHSLSAVDIPRAPMTNSLPRRPAPGPRPGALVGDAAHVPTPMTGRGFATSLDDAAAIARTLSAAEPDSVENTLLTYEQRRLATAAQLLVCSGQQFSKSFAHMSA